MNVEKHLCSLLRVVLPGVGITLTCVGVYVLSLQAEHMLEGDTLRVVPAYVTIVLGLLAVLGGVFWTIFHSMKSKMYRRRANRQRIQIYTVERPTHFPPLYEESQQSHARADTSAEFVVPVDGLDTAMSPAPPLYSQDSSEAPDCTWSWEQPPRYSQVVGIQVAAGERREAMSGH